MSFSVDDKLPGNYFKEVMDAQAEMVRMYLDDLDSLLIFSLHCGSIMMTFKFYSCDDNDDSPLLCYQLYCFWIQLITC